MLCSPTCQVIHGKQICHSNHLIICQHQLNPSREFYSQIPPSLSLANCISLWVSLYFSLSQSSSLSLSFSNSITLSHYHLLIHYPSFLHNFPNPVLVTIPMHFSFQPNKTKAKSICRRLVIKKSLSLSLSRKRFFLFFQNKTAFVV